MQDFGSMLPKLKPIIEEAARLALDTKKSLEQKLKPDGTIVTNADVLVENFLQEKLTKLCPGTNYWGEEAGYQPEGAKGFWVVDPIDGTSNYAAGIPLWGISVALVIGNEVVLGAIVLPELKQIYLAAKGHGATCNGKAMQPIPPGKIKPTELVGYSDGLIRAYPDCKIPGKCRYMGAFVVEAMFVAQQHLRAMVGRKEKLYDIAASVLILKELGAVIRYADGTPFEIADLKKDKKISKPWVVVPEGEKFTIA